MKCTFLVSYIVLNGLLLAEAIRELCPPPELILPCTCNVHNGKIDCKRKSDSQPLTVFQRVYKHYKNPKIIRSSEELTKGQILEMSPTTDMISVIDLPITNVADNAFSDAMNSIVTVKFINTSLVNIPFESLQYLSHLEELMIRFTKTYVRVSKMEIDRLPTSIQHVLLMDNNIVYVEKNCFVSLPNLAGVSLAGNLISSVNYRIFPNKINYIDFGENLFSEFPLKALKNCAKPGTVIFFNFNRIRVLREDNLKPLMLLKPNTIDISYNPIVCDCSMKWLAVVANRNLGFGGTCYGENQRANIAIGELYIQHFSDC